MEFTGYRVNKKGVIFGVINPVLLLPLIFSFSIWYAPFQLLCLTLVVFSIALDVVYKMKGGEFLRCIKFFMNKERVLLCTCARKKY